MNIRKQTFLSPLGLFKLLIWFILAVTHIEASPYLFPIRDTEKTQLRPWLETLLSKLPASTEPPAGMPPIILFDGLEQLPLDTATIRALRVRGITPTHSLKLANLTTLQNIQAAGCPVILTGRRSFDFPESNLPYSLAGATSAWAHQYPEGAQDIPQRWRQLPCPTLESGWQLEAEALQRTFAQIQTEGIQIQGVWLDFENEPATANYAACRACLRCQQTLPEAVLADQSAFDAWKRTYWIQLTSQYIALSIRTYFPQAQVTNWSYIWVTEAHPALDWREQPRPLAGPNWMNATNPVAYGADTPFLLRAARYMPFDQAEVDWLYAQIVLEQAFADTRNRLQIDPQTRAIPWVARWVTHRDVGHVPMMSRAAYRECLRHLWMTGLGGMQVFNPRYPEYSGMALWEVEDALTVYRELFEYRDFIVEGTPFAPRIAAGDQPETIVSGLQLGDSWLIRATSFSGRPHKLEIELTSATTTTLTATPEGSFYTVGVRQGRNP